MKYTLFGVAVVLLFTLIGTAVAQEPVVVANIPFAFTVGHAKFPAGTYTIEQQGMTNDMLIIKGDSGSAMVPVTRAWSPRNSAETALNFVRNGSTYALNEVIADGAGFRWDLPTGHTKAVIAQNGSPVHVAAALAK